MLTRAQRPFDFVISDANGAVRTVVEAKKWRSVDRGGAEDFAAGAIRRGLSSKWLVLVTPTRGFAWAVEEGGARTLREEFEVEPLLAPYYTRQRTDPSKMDPLEFELAVGAWLEALQTGDDVGRLGDTLRAALRGGDVHPAAA